MNSRLILHRKSTLVHEACKQLSHVPKDAQHTDTFALRAQLLHLDGVCEYCRVNKATTEDHFFALVVNSRPTQFCDDLWNRVPACSTCNSSKGNLSWYNWLTSSRRGNPFKGMPIEQLHKAQTRLAAYEDACLKHCVKKSIDDDWWDDVQGRITRFLQDLQLDVDTHSMYKKRGSCSLKSKHTEEWTSSHAYQSKSNDSGKTSEIIGAKTVWSRLHQCWNVMSVVVVIWIMTSLLMSTLTLHVSSKH